MIDPAADYATRNDVRRVEDKLDGLSNSFITRQEYTAAQTAQTQLLAHITAQITEQAKQVEQNRQSVERTNAEGGKWLLDQFAKLEERLGTRLDAHVTSHSKNNQWLVGLLYGTGSAVVAGIAIAVLQHVLH